MFWRKQTEILNLELKLAREKDKVFNRNKFIDQQQKELDETKAKYMKLRTFELMVENLVNGKREPEDIIDRIKKELLSLR